MRNAWWKLALVADLDGGDDLTRTLRSNPGEAFEEGDTAILKDEERCIRCALCAQRCPSDAIAMERTTFSTEWSTS